MASIHVLTPAPGKGVHGRNQSPAMTTMKAK
jgi:hypothetical protein